MEQTCDLIDFGQHIFWVRYKVAGELGKKYSLSATEMDILLFLYLYPDKTTAAEIERKKQLKKNTISVRVESLVQRGLLVRQELSGDRRKVKLSLTEEARSIASAYKIQYDRLKQRLTEGLSQEDLAVLFRCFKAINSNALELLKNE